MTQRSAKGIVSPTVVVTQTATVLQGSVSLNFLMVRSVPQMIAVSQATVWMVCAVPMHAMASVKHVISLARLAFALL